MNVAELQSLIAYDPATGEFTWLPRCGDSHGDKIFNEKYAGLLAGVVSRNRRYIGINQRLYSASRLAWLYMTGEWPKAEIDHKDGNSLNNRFDNLRDATRTQNGANRGKHKNNKSGVKGVSFHHGKWVAQAGGRTYGTKIRSRHDTLEEAQAAYAAMVEKIYGEFARVA